MKFFKLLLFPISLIYGGVTRLRNHLYNIQYKPAFHFETITISVGNLSVGGTGKTPMVEYLIRLLKDQYKVATLSRGYGRKTNGFIIASEQESADTVGDEPYQFYHKFGKEVMVAVGEERAVAIPEILFNREEIEVILLDDAFQHRKVERDLNILLTTFDKPFFSDMLLPAGRLRESATGAERANVVIVTKCPQELDDLKKEYFRKNISNYTSTNVPVFFSSTTYDDPVPVYGSTNQSPEGTAILVSGLANPSHFEEQARKKYEVGHHLKFNDHHRYTLKDIQQIKSTFEALQQQEKFILTTEKDMVKFLIPYLKSGLASLPIYYLPIRVEFLGKEIEFKELVINSIQKRKDSLTGII